MLIVKIISVFISCLILLDSILIFQQTHYKINELISYYKKRFILDIIPVIIIFEFLLTSIKMDIIYYLYISLYFILNIRKPKVKLVYTKRVKRMIIICLPFICLSYFNIIVILLKQIIDKFKSFRVFQQSTLEETYFVKPRICRLLVRINKTTCSYKECTM